MAKDKNSGEPQSIPGDAEIKMLDELSENCIPNAGEIITIHSDKLGRDIQITRGDVYKQASVMASNNQVAHLFGIDRKTMAKHFSRELDMARAFAKQKLLTRFYHLAVYGNNPADRIFALKNWAGMSDSGMIEELGDMEEGVEFKVKRPQKPIETLPDSDTQLEIKDETLEDENESPRV